MKLRENKSGFTLLEIIIVIIIVGVLASLALPKFFRTVEYSRATEAFINLNAIRQSMERCYLQRSSYAGCGNFPNLDILDPTNLPGTHFSYSIPAFGATNYTIRATRNTLDGGGLGDDIDLVNNGVTITRSGTGNFSGIQ